MMDRRRSYYPRNRRQNRKPPDPIPVVLMVQMGISVEEITRELEKRHVIDHKVKQERMQ